MAARRRSARDNLRLAVTVGGLFLLMGVAVVVATLAVEQSFRVGNESPSRPPGARTSQQAGAPERSSSPGRAGSDLDYVAMGDSYAAGPGLYEQIGEPAACQRSSNNYPSVLAAWLGTASFVDVSCTGAADTAIVGIQLRPDGTRVSPQVDALNDETDLVTLSLGGNISAVVQRLISTCTSLAPSDPSGHPCQDAFGGADDNVLYDDASALGEPVADAMAVIREGAPGALVVMVGYPQPFPSDTTCPQLPFAQGDVKFAARVIEVIDRSLQLAARAARVRYIDLLGPSTGHSICSEDPWIVGAQSVAGGGTAFHPGPTGMQAVAAVVYRQLTGVDAP